MSHQHYKISGVPVLFPGKPYPSQFSMMDRIIKGIERRQHCLLESPTGSGKSLALLCSSLAWLMEEKAKKNIEDQEELEKDTCVCACHVSGASSEGDSSAFAPKTSTNTEQSICVIDDDEDVFKKDAVNFNVKSSEKKNPRKHISLQYESEGIKSESEGIKSTSEKEKQDCKICSCASNDSTVHRRIPKIFFGTRTHKQVAQIVRELGKTEYKSVNMTILASREHTCIHPTVSKSKSKIEGCKELLNGPGCPLKDKVQRYVSHEIVKGQGLSSAWDLEDLVSMCKPKKICPYFLSRGLKEDADLVICPYNYLVDPLIRDAMSLNLNGHVVILDEGHNIEDSAREAASQTIPHENITAAIKDIDELMLSHNLADYSKLIYVLRQLDRFIEENKNSLEQKEFNQSYKIWTGFHIVAQLEAMGMGPKHFPDLKRTLVQIKTDAEERKEQSARTGEPHEEMKPITLTVLEQLFVVMDFLYRRDLKYADDYRASLVQSTSFVPRHEESQWLSSRNRNGGRKMFQVDVLNLNFWCMNPAVAFSDFAETRSVILTSGTLSPMTSFQSELGLDFKIQLEANHVIKDSQVWVGSLGQGPNGTSLLSVYRNMESFTFQDELGQVILQVCKTVPHGVLCFLPSYKVLDRLYTRWESTGLLDKVGERKKVFREPRSSSKEDFEEQIVSYYRAVESTNDPDDSVDGAIMFAVCRGKISEGLDFADDFARAVISIGIPYPNFKDIQVELKRKYNDQHRQTRGLTSGSDWYEIQAFRALNQALGRCIRHRNDWGALIIIDERFVKSAPKYTKGLSKWVRNKMCTHDNYTRGMNSLKEFIIRRKEEEKAEKLNALVCQPTTPVTPKAPVLDTNSSTSVGYGGNGFDFKNNGAKLQDVKTETPKTGSPNLRQYSIFAMAKSHPKSSSKQTKYPKLSAITSPSLKNHPSSDSSLSTAPSTVINSHQLPTAVVHPSFVLPPKPLAPISNVLNQPAIENAFSHSVTAHQHHDSGSNIYLRANLNTTNNIGSVPVTKPSSSSSAHGLNPGSGNNALMANSATSVNQITNPVLVKSSNISLRIITPVAPPGTRMQVFEIDPKLHEIYGGNLNLPVSTTERLVYVVEPPQTPGGHPLARLIRLSKEEKEKLTKANVKMIQQQQLYKERGNISDVENPRAIASNNPESSTSANQLLQIPSHNASLHSNDNREIKSERPEELFAYVNNSNEHFKENTESKTSNLRICNTTALSSNAHNKSNVTDGTQDSLEEEPNSSLSLFDSPATTVLNSCNHSPQQPIVNGSHNVISHNDHSVKGNNSSPTNSVNTGSAKKNPLLKFFQSSDNTVKTDPKDLTKVPTLSESIVENTSSSSKVGSSMFLLKEESLVANSDKITDFRDIKMRKPLFKINDKSSASSDATNNIQSNVVSLTNSSESDTNCHAEQATGLKTKNIRRSVSKNLESSPIVREEIEKLKEEGEEEEQEMDLKVKKKCGRKRRSLSLKAHDEENKKHKSDTNDSSKERTAKSVSRTFGCLQCGESFFDGKDVPATAFNRQKIPPFLSDDDGDNEAMNETDCFFFQTNPGQGGLTELVPGKKGPKHKHVEEEDIYIQFLFCSHCCNVLSKSDEMLVRPCGARIMLTSAAGTRFAKGQLWLFSHSLSK